MSSSPKYQYENLKVHIYPEGVAHVELYRPKRLNAINEALVEDIRVCFNTLGQDSTIRAIILSGHGRTFTSGIDFKDNFLMKGEPDTDVARRAYTKRLHIEWFQSAMSALEKCPQPVIVAMHYGVYGVAVDLCTAGDIRYGTKDSFYTVKEVDLGLAPDVGTLQRLPKVIGSDSLARELCFTGRNMYADEAYKCGLISKLFDTKEEMIEDALKTARVIASKSPVAVVSSKHLLNYSRDHSVDEGLQYTAVWNSAMLQTEDIPKSIQGFMQKKPAHYSNL
ncbi:hypothetical protein INT45_002404 [Circinella minor]|uniref:Enoyl-CoA hydratase n=1 Tax=Circinella minor TaxID=1195481 RepID=A0A8H7RW04_9FUNG|nr:hypothetical protein INT45_002404 [Circinella minor]